MIRKRPHPLSGARVQILSDLHLEVGQQYLSYIFPVSAPFLLLGGDVGRLTDYDGYLKFLEAQVSRYEKVFLVLGNHEFYGLDYESGLDTARRLSEDPSLAMGTPSRYRRQLPPGYVITTAPGYLTDNTCTVARTSARLSGGALTVSRPGRPVVTVKVTGGNSNLGTTTTRTTTTAAASPTSYHDQYLRRLHSCPLDAVWWPWLDWLHCLRLAV
ncbi:hypothetical protein DL770_008088 [Monosporascus sp. CRB-9-2]|nr:hypothetical protein DL770_008088 [Monosporascus sp. CRB-9-2]